MRRSTTRCGWSRICEARHPAATGFAARPEDGDSDGGYQHGTSPSPAGLSRSGPTGDSGIRFALPHRRGAWGRGPGRRRPGGAAGPQLAGAGAGPPVAKADVAALRALSPLLCWCRHNGAPSASANVSDSPANAMRLRPGSIDERCGLWPGLGLVAPRTRYPDHRHAPEETYPVLSPGQFRKDGSGRVRPGGGFFVPPNAPRALRSGGQPLFAVRAG
nr:dimethylsulfonioproprionate lyase family protein [Paracoccus sp. pheM1]